MDTPIVLSPASGYLPTGQFPPGKKCLPGMIG